MAERARRLVVGDLVAALAGPEHALPPGLLSQAEIHSAVIDSRLAKPGCLFIALRGEHHDGHDFIPEALEKGAVAIIAETAPAPNVCAALSLAGGPLERGAISPDAPLCLVVPDSCWRCNKRRPTGAAGTTCGWWA